MMPSFRWFHQPQERPFSESSIITENQVRELLNHQEEEDEYTIYEDELNSTLQTTKDSAPGHSIPNRLKILSSLGKNCSKYTTVYGSIKSFLIIGEKQ